MANKRNKIVKPETDHIKPDCFLYCNISNATSQNLPMLNQSENQRLLHKTLDDLIRSTTEKMKNKQVDLIISDINISTPRKPEEKTTYISPPIENNVIKRNLKIVDRLNKKTIDAITSTAQIGFDKTCRENVSNIVKDFAHDVSLRHADCAAKYVDNVIPERGCTSQHIDTQSGIINEKFRSETNLDSFTKACKQRRHIDFILDEIGRISDALTERAHLTFAAKSEKSDPESCITLPADKMEKELFEKAKSLISIYSQEKPNILTAEAVTTVVLQRQIVDSEISVSSIHFIQESLDPSACWDAMNKGEEEEKKKENNIFLRSILDTIVLAVFQHIAIIHTVAKDDRRKEKRREKEIDICPPRILDEDVRKKEEKMEEQIDIPLQQMPDKDVFVETVDSTIIDSIQELEEDASQITTLPSKEAIEVIDALVDSFVYFDHIEEEPMKLPKDTVQEIIPVKHEIRKQPSIEAPSVKFDVLKPLIDRSCFTTKKDKIVQCEKIEPAKDLDVSTCTFISFTLSEPIRPYCERLSMKMCLQDDRSRLPRILQPTRCLTPSNIYLGKSKYCDIWTTSCVIPQIAVTRKTTLSVLCPSLQDSRSVRYRRALIDSRNAILRHCNINCCTKHRTTFENSLCTTHDMRCRGGIKYCYPRLNNINNVRIGYYHCNSNCPIIWNNNQHCERSRSSHSYHWWTRGNLYFIHPCTSRY